MESLTAIEPTELSKLKVPELKKELKLRNLSTAGNKNELLERLQCALQSKPKESENVETVDDLDEDLLNDEDDEHLDESESVLNDLDSPVETPDQKSLKRKSSDTIPEEPPKQTKKIILNRNLSSTDSVEVPPENNHPVVSEEKKVIKLSELSAKERLEMRAKKFGMPLSSEAKKEARAARFNTNSSAKSISTVSTSVDVLKQRAERFGKSVSTVLNKMENQERLEKRKERFGQMNGSSLSDEAKAKAQQRLERFKQPVK